MLKMNFFLAALFTWSLVIVPSVTPQDNSEEEKCRSAETCGACIQAGLNCRWCDQESFKADRCGTVARLQAYGCNSTNIQNEKSSSRIDKNEPVRDGANTDDSIQLAPQKITLKLRPHEAYTFNLTYRQAENYPVDLYYLMDLSNSMKDDKEKLSELGGKIAEDMSKITKNFRLGFGSFVDKMTMPYVSTVPERLANPCFGPGNEPCAPAYSFINQMPLTAETKVFKDRVQNASVSGNLDDPEGGFDALMQVLVCKKQIGWRDVSRKLIIFSTDASYHFAGDGLLGGIVVPNDGKCHLNEENEYTHALLQDYPSVSHIAYEVQQSKVNIIFAVTGGFLKTYQDLSKEIDGSTVGQLTANSDNIVTLIRENYKNISSKVELQARNAQGLSVSFKSKCTGTEIEDTATCSNINIGQSVTFDVTVKASSCPENPNEKHTFQIVPVGLNDKLEVTVEYQCQCGCEKIGEANSTKCNGTGTYECGTCTCNTDRYGEFCQCNVDSNNRDDFDSACKMGNDTSVCSGHGTCECGKCKCSPISSRDPKLLWDGEFCQCNNYDCPHSFQETCGGKSRGTCECSKCICNSAYSGDACECKKSKEACLGTNGKECNGIGTCECGTCKCPKNSKYRGPTCEDCPTCQDKCESKRSCVQCRVFNSGSKSPVECDKCPKMKEVNELKKSNRTRQCEFLDDKDQCKVFFAYEYDDDSKISVQRTKQCPKPQPIKEIIIGIVVGIIVIGLALLFVWKCVVTVADRREYAKFEQERQQAKWNTDVNPLYKQAVSTVQNPAFGGKQ